MRKVEDARLRSARMIAVLAAAFLLASCADGGFQWPWSKKPETVTETPPPPPPQPASKKEIRKIQAGLARLGYRPGPVDGKSGPKTKRAVRKYQSKHGLPEDGDTTVALLTHIESTLKVKLADERRQPRLPLPSYIPGTEFVYQNGDVDRVEDVRKGEVKWRRSNGVYVISAPNFLLPRKYWETAKKRGKSVLTDGDKPVWPSRKNESKSFVVVKTAIDRANESNMRSVEEKWQCTNKGNRRLSVLAGTFDTVRFVCTHVESSAPKPARRIWHYAPEIRHFVRLDEFTEDNPAAIRHELVAIRPGALKWPPVARAALEQRLIAALNTTPVGGTAQWKSSGISTDVAVKISSEYFDPKGHQCRRYLQTWSQGSRERQYPGVACRDKAGVWRLPVATGSTRAALAVASRTGR